MIRRVSTFALLLALLSAVRPTSLAAVYAILGSPRPRRLLLVFNVAGMAVTLSVGVILVVFLERVVGASQNTYPVVNLVLAAVCFAGAAALTRRPAREPGSREATRKITAQLRNPSVAAVAAAGVLTHLPGLVYLIALNAIIASEASLTSGIGQLLVYNAIWFAIPLLSLALAVVRPERTSAVVAGVTGWTRRNRRTAVPLLLIALGIYLLVKGLVDLT
jgi:hypothetical protein